MYYYVLLCFIDIYKWVWSKSKSLASKDSFLRVLREVAPEIELFLENHEQYADGNNFLHTPLVNHFNDLLERESSERGKDEVSYLLLCWGRFSYTPWNQVCRFSRKNLCGDFWEKVFPEISTKIFS